MKYQTPTHNGNVMHNNLMGEVIQKVRRFEITIRVLEGKLLKDTSTMLFQMKTYVTIDLEKSQNQLKTQA